MISAFFRLFCVIHSDPYIITYYIGRAVQGSGFKGCKALRGSYQKDNALIEGISMFHPIGERSK